MWTDRPSRLRADWARAEKALYRNVDIVPIADRPYLYYLARSGNGVGYASIVAAGDHGPVLHWTRDDGAVRPGDLVLLDAGVEARTLYTADVTRTFPASGEFSRA